MKRKRGRDVDVDVIYYRAHNESGAPKDDTTSYNELQAGFKIIIMSGSQKKAFGSKNSKKDNKSGQ